MSISHDPPPGSARAAAEDYERLQTTPTGAVLVNALQAGPKDDLDLPAATYRPAVRAVEL